MTCMQTPDPIEPLSETLESHLKFANSIINLLPRIQKCRGSLRKLQQRCHWLILAICIASCAQQMVPHVPRESPLDPQLHIVGPLNVFVRARYKVEPKTMTQNKFRSLFKGTHRRLGELPRRRCAFKAVQCAEIRVVQAWSTS